MATYDLEQQEQLEQVKHFWKQYGNLITWALVLVVGAYAAWTGYLYWQQQRSQGAGGLYEELDRAAMASNANKVAQAFADLKSKYAGTTFAEQGALLAAKAAIDEKKADQAKAPLQWLIDSGKNQDLIAVARLRLAGVQMDAKQYDDALKTLNVALPQEFAPLADDRRGDVLFAQGKKEEAAKAYLAAWTGMDEKVEYRRFVEGKLTALGQSPARPKEATPAAVASSPLAAAAPASR